MQRFELSFEQFEQLSHLAHDQGLLFISTPLDLDSAAFLSGIVDGFKIASGDINFYPLIRMAAASDKPLVVSTGASDMAQVDETVSFIREIRKSMPQERLALLHCISSYPTPLEQVNLRSIPFLAQQTGCPVGYSDHTLGIEASLAAVALGACIIEKHFTLDKNYSDFRDHQLSADPAEMKQLVDQVNLIGSMLGRDEKVVQPCEKEMLPAIRRSVVAARSLPAAYRLQQQDLMWLRPAGGLAPGNEALLLDKKTLRSIEAGERLTPDDVGD